MSSTITRIRFTPLRDLLRGRLTARLDWRSVITAADVPDEIRAIVLDVVRRTRLWRIEKADVAAELLAHFTDALATEVSPSEAITAFGNPRAAAKLIRRAKVRNRSLLWHASRWMARIAGVLCLFYACLAIYYYTGSPLPKIDYVAQMNRVIEQTPPEQRAWPLYRTAILALRDPEAEKLTGYSADGKHWPEIAAWIDAHQPMIETIQSGSDRPSIGFVLGDNGSVNDRNLYPKLPRKVDDTLISVLPPHLSGLREFANILALDAKRARELHDGNRAVRDIVAVNHLAAQEHHDANFIVENLVSIGFLAVSYNQLDRTLTDTPDLLDNATLVRLAHQIAAPHIGADLMSFQGENLIFKDVIQRTFTDDGHGDGRLSGKGFDFYRAHVGTGIIPPGEGSAPQKALLALVQPAALLVMASRKELLDEDERIVDLNENVLSRPLRDADPNAVVNELRSLNSSYHRQMQYVLISMVAPSLHRAAATAEIALGTRDGLLVGIALELYHRRHGQYPETLQQLTPDLLPQVPADRITGEPLKYRLINGKPLVYSVGADRKDDGGRVPVVHERMQPNAAATWSGKPTDGDWILFPQPRVPLAEGDD